ncbi:MAG TPA: hypothetical protein VK446_14240, partial [Methylocystis sp.]|nr:hypothetical protein [Methylocystis sp.]
MSDATMLERPAPADGQDAAPVEHAGDAPASRLGAWLRGLAARAPAKADLGRLAFGVVVPVFLWVFYTTSSGMIDIMRRDGDDAVGVIGTFVG